MTVQKSKDVESEFELKTRIPNSGENYCQVTCQWSDIYWGYEAEFSESSGNYAIIY
jgi:hypothetical protein